MNHGEKASQYINTLGVMFHVLCHVFSYWISVLHESGSRMVSEAISEFLFFKPDPPCASMLTHTRNLHLFTPPQGKTIYATGGAYRRERSQIQTNLQAPTCPHYAKCRNALQKKEALIPVSPICEVIPTKT